MILSFILSSALLNDKLLNLIFTLTKKLFFFCSVDLRFFIEGFIPSDIRYSMLTAEANLPPTKKTRSALNFINLQEISKTRFCDVKFIQKICGYSTYTGLYKISKYIFKEIITVL